MEGPSHIDLSYFSAVESLTTYSNDYARLSDTKRLANVSERLVFRENRTAGVIHVHA